MRCACQSTAFSHHYCYKIVNMNINDTSEYQPVSVQEKCKTYDAPKGFGTRHCQALVLFISLSIAFTLRAQLSVTMVAITDVPNFQNCTENYENSMEPNPTTDINITSFDNSICKYRNLEEYHAAKGSWDVYRTYNWSKPTQEMIMFSFFVGYTSMMVPMGLVAQRFGGKTPIVVALLANGILSIIMPWVPIFGGWIALAACRLIQGATQACFFPSIHTMLGKWAPLSERGRLSTYIYTGSQFGTVLIFPIAGYLSGHPSLGWPAAFWLCGALSLVACGLVAAFIASSPHDHPTISIEELGYIVGTTSATNGDFKKNRPTPWGHIFRCRAVWGMIVTHCGSAVGYLYVFTQIPLYMNKILGVDIKNSGIYSSLPYIGMYVSTLCFGALSDFLVNNKYMKLVNIRRLGNTIGMAISGGFLIAFSFMSSTLPAVILLVLSLATHSGVLIGFMINQIDLAPNFAGPLMAFGNMLGSLSALGVPLLVSNIVHDVSDQSQWQTVTLIIGVIQIVTNTVYVLLARADLQPWNNLPDYPPHNTSTPTLTNSKELKLLKQDNISIIA